MDNLNDKLRVIDKELKRVQDTINNLLNTDTKWIENGEFRIYRDTITSIFRGASSITKIIPIGKKKADRNILSVRKLEEQRAAL